MKCACPPPPKPYTHTLVVEQPKPIANIVGASGQPDLNDDANWNVIGQIRARFMTKGDMETLRAATENHMQVQAYSNSVLYSPASALSKSLNPTMRLRFGTRKLNIISANLQNEIGKEVQILIKERV